MNSPQKRGSSVKRRPVHGVLLLDKPIGLSSNQALQKAKWPAWSHTTLPSATKAPGYAKASHTRESLGGRAIHVAGPTAPDD